MTTPAPTGTEHAPTVRPGIVGPGAPGHRIFESNFVVECPCGHRANIASLNIQVAHESAARHLRDVETGLWKPPGWYRTQDDDFERDITYVVEYDHVVRRRCIVTISFDADRTAGSTVNAIEEAVRNGETGEDYEIGDEYDIVSWKEKA